MNKQKVFFLCKDFSDVGRSLMALRADLEFGLNRLASKVCPFVIGEEIKGCGFSIVTKILFSLRTIRLHELAYIFWNQNKNVPDYWESIDNLKRLPIYSLELGRREWLDSFSVLELHKREPTKRMISLQQLIACDQNIHVDVHRSFNEIRSTAQKINDFVVNRKRIGEEVAKIVTPFNIGQRIKVYSPHTKEVTSGEVIGVSAGLIQDYLSLPKRAQFKLYELEIALKGGERIFIKNGTDPCVSDIEKLNNELSSMSWMDALNLPDIDLMDENAVFPTKDLHS